MSQHILDRETGQYIEVPWTFFASQPKMKRANPYMSKGSSSKKSRTTEVVVVPKQPKLNAAQAAQVKRMVKSKTEKKYFRPGVQNDSLTLAAPTISSLANIAQGVADGQRIGDEIEYVSAKIKIDNIIGDSTNLTRFILFKWRENDQFTAPTIAQILATGPSGAVDPWSHYNDKTKDSYIILFDKTFVGSNGASSDSVRQFFQTTIPVKGHARYFADASTNGTNKLYAIRWSDSAAIPNPTMTWQVEVVYTDA